MSDLIRNQTPFKNTESLFFSRRFLSSWTRLMNQLPAVMGRNLTDKCHANGIQAEIQFNVELMTCRSKGR